MPNGTKDRFCRFNFLTLSLTPSTFEAKHNLRIPFLTLMIAHSKNPLLPKTERLFELFLEFFKLPAQTFDFSSQRFNSLLESGYSLGIIRSPDCLMARRFFQHLFG